MLIAVCGCPRRCVRLATAPRYRDLIVVAGLTIDGWPVTRDEMEDTLVRKVNEVWTGKVSMPGG